jgi:Family of unknown function (DUF6375)
MKAWLGYGSEHSANLVMIGKFENTEDARKTNDLLQQLIVQARTDEEAGLIVTQGETERFSEAMLKLLGDANLYTVGPSELEQFTFYFDVTVNGSSIVVKTDEVDVSALLKVFIRKGARVEVYSAHTYPGNADAVGK